MSIEHARILQCSAYAAEVEVSSRSHFGSRTGRRRPWVNVGERFWSKVDKHGPIVVSQLGRCWSGRARGGPAVTGSSGCPTRDGSYMPIDSPTSLRWGRFRESWRSFHACRNHACANPGHLEQVDTTTRVLRGEAPSAQRRGRKSVGTGTRSLARTSTPARARPTGASAARANASGGRPGGKRRTSLARMTLRLEASYSSGTIAACSIRRFKYMKALVELAPLGG
jgi:hypothetical protein